MFNESRFARSSCCVVALQCNSDVFNTNLITFYVIMSAIEEELDRDPACGYDIAR